MKAVARVIEELVSPPPRYHAILLNQFADYLHLPSAQGLADTVSAGWSAKIGILQDVQRKDADRSAGFVNRCQVEYGIDRRVWHPPSR